jgi:REP element-mobilizing transposase RayT
MRLERKITRMREFDYTQSGAYAITICVSRRRGAFGRMENGMVRLHPFGKIAERHWKNIPSHYSNIFLDEFIFMPNHMHGIVWIEGEAPPSLKREIELRRFGEAQSGSLSSIIGSYKSGVTKEIGELRGSKTAVWQPCFHDHIIRNDVDLFFQRQYIQQNPSQWAEDEFYTQSHR